MLAAIAWVTLNIIRMEPLCGNTVVADLRSPDGQHRAVLFERNCGATTGFSAQVSILGTSEKLRNESGNVMTAGGDPRNGTWAIKWIDATTLAIKVNSFEFMNSRQNERDGIMIRYVRNF